jgi:hypothetical protein
LPAGAELHYLCSCGRAVFLYEGAYRLFQLIDLHAVAFEQVQLLGMSGQHLGTLPIEFLPGAVHISWC